MILLALLNFHLRTMLNHKDTMKCLTTMICFTSHFSADFVEDLQFHYHLFTLSALSYLKLNIATAPSNFSIVASFELKW